MIFFESDSSLYWRKRERERGGQREREERERDIVLEAGEKNRLTIDAGCSRVERQ